MLRDLDLVTPWKLCAACRTEDRC